VTTSAVGRLGDRLAGQPRVRSLILGASCIVAALVAVEMLLAVWSSTESIQHGQDLVFYRTVAERWLDTGVYYLPRQLDGSGQLTLNVDVIYPPSALYLFVPFVWLPAAAWWIGPLAIVAAAVVRLRPARWTWPLLILSLAWPRTAGAIVFGNSDLWFAAFVWAGAAFAWPGVLTSMKPTVFPFGLIGVRHRSWWIAAAIFAVANLPLLPLWLVYPTVIRSAGLPLLYSIGNLPMFLAPVVAWAVRRRPVAR
jgi:hypothetical protein